MDINKALEIMGYTSIGDLTKESISKAFRNLMRKHHPDLFYNDPIKLAENEQIAKDINEAHEKVLKVLSQLEAIRQLEKLSSKQEVMAVIPFQSLSDIYNGGKIVLRGTEDTFELTKYNIRAHRIYLYIECNILCNNINNTFSAIKPFITSDEYSIECVIPVRSIEETIDAVVTTANKEVKLILRAIETKLTLRYDNGIKLEMHIRKSMASESDKGRS